MFEENNTSTAQYDDGVIYGESGNELQPVKLPAVRAHRNREERVHYGNNMDIGIRQPQQQPHPPPFQHLQQPQQPVALAPTCSPSPGAPSSSSGALYLLTVRKLKQAPAKAATPPSSAGIGNLPQGDADGGESIGFDSFG